MSPNNLLRAWREDAHSPVVAAAGQRLKQYAAGGGGGLQENFDHPRLKVGDLVRLRLGERGRNECGLRKSATLN